MENAIPVLVLFGPTASGKTALLEELFTGAGARCRAEIISADSMQVYRGMDIGTAKPEPALRERLPHHLIDIRNPDEQFNAGDFVRLADAACEEITGRGALPVIAGGTGFYLKNFIFGLPQAPPSNPAVRESLKKELSQKGPAALLEELARLDPVSAGRIHVNDAYRLLRALEVCRAGGLPLSAFATGSIPRPAYRFAVAGIQRQREELYRLIDERCEEMFRRGLAGEVTRLFEQGYGPQAPGLRAIGYREFFVPDGENGKAVLSKDTEGVKALVARNSRRYAKRQETFFSSMDAVLLPGQDRQKTLDLLSSLIHTLVNHNP
ncbi:MAG: tRNA (adenosine(37)-N6)-dimethylallyltransferase MiaA [Spirochaetaceae bacterium]|nr:tRNA (adenosine(37)-N6)-dimethylallyltransferase MiaA [Spirochaetaceae bacterium]